MVQLLGTLGRGKVIVVSAPAGTGKTTLVRRLIKEFPEYATQGISCTTRPPREGEVDGRDYIFLSQQAFEECKAAGEFLEWETIFGYQYGSLREVVARQRAGGKHVILVIDTRGALNLRKRVETVLIFVHPPSLAILKKRLKKRGTESKGAMQERLDRVQFELAQAKYYDYQIVGDRMAYQVFKSIVIAEGHKT